MSTTTLQKRYYPTLSSVVTAEDLPDILGFIKDGAQNLFSHIYYKDFQHSKGAKGDSAFYGLSIVSPQRVQLEILGTGIYLVLNPDLKDGDTHISVFPITIEYQWKVLAYLREFSLGNFSFTPQEIFEVALRVLNVTEEQAIAQFINTFVTPINLPNEEVTPLQQFVKDINEKHNLGLVISEDTNVSDIVTQIFQKAGGKYASFIAFSTYLLTNDPKETIQKVKDYFRAFIPQDIDEFIKEVIVPKFRATLLLSAGIEFPRSILKPVYPFGYKDANGNNLSLQENPDPDQKVMLTFGEALFYADTTKGFGYNMDLKLNTTCPAMIGNTGLIIDIHNLKIDLSKKENILEADLDGRPKDFMGVYMEQTDIYLPSKWFKKQNNQTLGIRADHFLVGTGGVSGKLSLAATYSRQTDGTVVGYYNNIFSLDYGNLTVINKENQEVSIANYDALLIYINSLGHPSELKFKYPIGIIHKNDTTNSVNVFVDEKSYYSYLNSLVFDENEFMWFKLGANENKQWDLGFNKFDITFHQGTVVNSNLNAALRIKKFTDENGLPAIINLEGEYHSKEEFRLSARFLPDKPLPLFNSIILTLQSAELGRHEDNFFIGADTRISFPEGTLANKLFKGQVIDLPAIRIYSNGRFEVVGGTSFIPMNFVLPLGPIEMSVTGIHLGGIQKEHNGKMRNYNFIGFDGGMSIDPIGIDARGKGVKYYYTTDNDEIEAQMVKDLGRDLTPEEKKSLNHNYFHISTIEVDLVIPGTASESQAIAIIKGALTIPEPGVSSEYVGKVSLKLPKAKLYAEANMKLDPKYPSFLLDASVELGIPIPLGPIGIYGFRGLIGYRYVADKQAAGLTKDNTWYDYYMAPQRGINIDKFRRPDRTKEDINPFSIGIGASMATLKPTDRIATLRAMMLLSLPSMFAIDAGLSILASRLGLPEEDATDANFYAFVIFGDNSLEFGAGADYKLSKKKGQFISINAEIQAGFFFKNQKPWYINFGTRNRPIQVIILKDILNFKSQGFLMISGSGIEVGAAAELRINLLIFKIHARVEVGGFISFERPQVGGYLKFDASFDFKFIIKIHVSLLVYFSLEVFKPFLLYALLQIKIRIKLFFVKIKITLKVELKWEFNKTIDINPIQPLTFTPISNTEIDYEKNKNSDKYVKGVHMLTYESFELNELNNNNLSEIAVPDVTKIDKIIPLDTYIDIKFEKALSPSINVDNKIGGHTSMATNFIELIPPKQMQPGGHRLRQVKHKYSIEDIEIKYHDGNMWKDYHTYRAMTPDSENTVLDNLKIGFWQKNSDQYDTIRIMACEPFSFLEGGEPGWFIPEDYGITPSHLFCQSTNLKGNFSNVLNKKIGDIYYPPANFNSYLINGAYFSLGNYDIIDTTIAGNENDYGIVKGADIMIVKSIPNSFNFNKSLEFKNSNSLVIDLPEPSSEVKLKISSSAKQVTFKYYTASTENYPNVVYSEIESATKTVPFNLLKDQVVFNSSDNNGIAISRVEVIPFVENRETIDALYNQLRAIKQDAILNNNGYYTEEQIEQSDAIEAEIAYLKNLSCNYNTLVKDEISFEYILENIAAAVPFEYVSVIINNAEDYFNYIINRINNLGITSLNVNDIDFNQYSVLYIDYGEGPTYNKLANKIYVKGNDLIVCHDITSDDEMIIPGPKHKHLVSLVKIPKLNSNKNIILNYDGGRLINSCKELQYDVLKYSENGADDNQIVAEIINSNEELANYNELLKELNEFGDIVYPIAPDFATKSVVFVNWGNIYPHPAADIETKILFRYNSVLEIASKLNFENENMGEGSFYTFLVTEKLSSNLQIIFPEMDADLLTCNDPNICSFADRIKQELSNAIKYDVEDLFWDNIDAFTDFLIKINNFDRDTGYVYAIGDSLEFDIPWNPNIGNTLEDAFNSVNGFIAYLKQIGSCPTTPTETNYNCSTYFHEINWLTETITEYNATIPGQDAVNQQNQDMVEAISNHIQPIWRPNTNYYIHFKLKDEASYNNIKNDGIFHYYYGFKTVGPIGHFQKKNPSYIEEYDENATLEEKEEIMFKALEKYPILTLGAYIDFKKSYPNADGNLLSAKPLFYGNEQCTINVYFIKPYVYNMFQNWKKYNNTGEIEYKSSLNIIIKDPISEEKIKYPLDSSTLIDPDSIPVIDNNGENNTSWTGDDDPRIPENIRILNSYINNINAGENSNIQCQLVIGDIVAPESPKAYNFTVKVQNLKPQKLYTANFYNAFDENKDGSFEPVMDVYGRIAYDENQKVHEYVFVTSRYQNFREQVISYNLKIQDEEGNVIETKQAVYNNGIDLVQKQVDNAFLVVSGNGNIETNTLSARYINDFDKIVEGIFNLKPMHPANSTEFIKIINENNNDIVALLVRNPEPFNDPKIPLEDISDTLTILNADGNTDDSYKVLYSKDYSQMIIMNDTKNIDSNQLIFKFKYKVWDYISRKYVCLENSMSTIITEPIIIK